jgi:LAO/AO transport system kinase
MLEIGHPSSRTQLMSHHGQSMRVEVQPKNNGHAEAVWIPPIVQTVASEGKGVDELIGAIESHREHLKHTNIMAQIESRQIEIELSDRLREAVMARMMRAIPAEFFGEIVRRVQTRQTAPQVAVQEVLTEAAERGAL